MSTTRETIRRVAGSASIGTVLEWYDFFIYGTAAALIFPQLFFPQTDPFVGTVLSFATYATGFLARPLGSVLAGHFGDRLGRKGTLLVTLFTMGIATTLIGLLPTYAQIGILAPILLVGIRLVQGLAAGGEWGGATTLTLEHSKSRRAFWGSFVAMGIYAGLLLGNLAFVVVDAALPESSLMAWGWRIPFLAGILLVVLGVYMRLRVSESPEFEALQRNSQRSRNPIWETLKRPRNLIAIFLIRVGPNTSFYVTTVFLLAYANGLGIERSVTLLALLIGAGAAVIASPLWGMLAGRVGYRPVLLGSIIATIVAAAPLFLIFETRSAVLIVLGLSVAIAGVNASTEAIQPGYFTGLFPTRSRYSGIAIGRELSSVVGGGLAPLIAALLLGWVGHWWIVAVWMVVMSLLGFIGLALVRPLVDEDADVVDAAVAAPAAVRGA